MKSLPQGCIPAAGLYLEIVPVESAIFSNLHLADESLV
jgi:hypothetical protein